ncbi:unnamed protein product, partial [Callosobruchus maculatus]
FDDSYKALADLKDIKNVKVSIRFPAELRHPNPAPLASGGNLWNTEKKVEGSVQNGPRNPQSSIGGYPSMY